MGIPIPLNANSTNEAAAKSNIAQRKKMMVLRTAVLSRPRRNSFKALDVLWRDPKDVAREHGVGDTD